MGKTGFAVTLGAVVGAALLYGVIALMQVEEQNASADLSSINEQLPLTRRLQPGSSVDAIFLEPVPVVGSEFKIAVLSEVPFDDGSIGLKQGESTVAVIEEAEDGSFHVVSHTSTDGVDNVLRGRLLWGRGNEIDKALVAACRDRRTKRAIEQLSSLLYGAGGVGKVDHARLSGVLERVGLRVAAGRLKAETSNEGLVLLGTDESVRQENLNVLSELAILSWRYERVFGWRPQGAPFLPTGTRVTLTVQ